MDNNGSRIKVFLIFSALMFFTALTSFASVKTVTAPEVKKMVEQDNPFLVHVLSRVEFEGQHIPGSINIPINELNDSDKLPKELDRPIIFYCMGLR